MAKVKNNEMEVMEKKLAEYLDERFEICTTIPDTSRTNNAFYEGICAAVAQIGGWERDGKKLKASSRLKAFEQIVMSMWGLIQVGKVS